MGLDTVELVIEVEETFSIEIPEYDASQIITVGDLFEYIVSHSKSTINTFTCLSASTFYQLRRAANQLGVENKFRPSDSLSELLPANERTAFWKELQAASNLKLPDLQRPGWLVTGCTLMVLACSFGIGYGMYFYSGHFLGSFVVGLLMCLGLSLIAILTTEPYAIFPGNNFTTLRGLTESTLALNYETLTEVQEQSFCGISKEAVWIKLRHLIAENLGAPLESVTYEASFVGDLGAD